MKTVAIIPARGGSKRIPHKNIIDFGGKPMMAWTIEAAQKSKLFDLIFVSTDDEKIAEVGRQYGAAVPFLRDDKNDDISPVSEATVAALKQIKKHMGLEFDYTVQLMANCPLRDEEDIRKSFKHFVDNNLDHQISSFRFGWQVPWWACRVDEAGRPTPIFPNDPRKTRSQDLPTVFSATGSIWIAKTKELLKTNSFFGPDLRYHELSWISAVDIDEHEDVRFGLAALQLKLGKL